MKGITVQQPWAWAIIHGGKTVENRTQMWTYRGPLAIHAGARWSQRGGHSSVIRDAFAPWMTFSQYQRPIDSAEHYERFPFRAIIGVVDLVGTHFANGECCAPWGDQTLPPAGGFVPPMIVHLELENPRSVQPIDYKGRLGLWNVPADIEAMLA